jgi:preprotein translocase subunit SecF
MATKPKTRQRTTVPTTGAGLRKHLHIEFVKRWKIWFALSTILLLISGGSLLVRGLSLGIEFEGGSVWQLPAGDASVGDARDALAPFGLDGATIQTTEDATSEETTTMLRVATDEVGSQEEVDEISAALEEVTGHEIEMTQQIGPTWGREITEKARDALVVFLIMVAIYIALRFRLKSALPAIVALAHDVIITVGIYSLGQFTVTPATVIAFLTILGYSLYDTVVVFDKVEENNNLVGERTHLTYSGMVNLSLNQTLMRSVNTTVTALLPVASLLVVGAWVMGASTLQDFALALLIGLIAGAYSSFFVASPLLALLREREPALREIRAKVVQDGHDPTAVPARVTVLAEAGRSAASRKETAAETGGPLTARSQGKVTGSPTSDRVIPPRPRKKGKQGKVRP